MEEYKEYIPEQEDARIRLIKNVLMVIGAIIAAPFFLGYLLFGHTLKKK